MNEKRNRGKCQVLTGLCARIILWFLTVIMKPGYIGEFEIRDGHGAGKVCVNLTGRLNRCETISCRFDVLLKNLVKWHNNPPLSRQLGSIVLTPAGIMGHKEARGDKPRILF